MVCNIFFSLDILFLFGLDLYIRCNGRVLDQYDYQIAKTVLSFETPARLPDENRLHIIIYNKKTKDQIVVEPQYRSHGIVCFLCKYTKIINFYL